MSKLFIWKLGDLDSKYFPNQEVIKKLTHLVVKVSDDLKENNHAHLIWGPGLNVEVFDVDDDAKHVIISVEEIEGGNKVKIDIE